MNALLFTVFGVSLRTLIWANLALLAALCVLVYRLFAAACGRFTATCVVLVQLAVFSFSQYTGIGNYNYVCPYTHEQTHGILLATAMIAALTRAAREGSGAARWRGVTAAAAAGACLGTLFLTKAELFVPALAAAAAGMVLLAAAAGGRRLDAVARAFGAGSVVPVVAMALFLARSLPWPLVLKGVAGNWSHLGGGILDYKFYRVGMGLDDPLGNAWWSLRLFAAIVVVVALAAAGSWLTRGVAAARAWWAAALGLGVFGALVTWPDVVPWRQLGRPLPWTTTAVLAALIVAALRARGDAATRARLLAPVMWATLACALLGKVWLNVRISHYGFVLAMPATLLLVATVVHAVPALLERRVGSGALTRACLTAVVLAGVVFFLRWSQMLYAQKTFAVGDGGDLVYTTDPEINPRGYALAAAAEWLRGVMPADATLLAAPEGLMLNYWLRRPNPTRDIYFVPWSIDYAGGEQTVLRDLQTHAPDFIALVHRDADEFGYGYFGDPGYGRDIVQWIRGAYRRVYRIGAEPLTDARFGLLILERGDRRSPAP